MEKEHPITDPPVARAVRSLDRNRRIRQITDRRIERAESQIRGYLMLKGQGSARIFDYQVELENEEIRVTQLSSSDAKWRQLRLGTPRENMMIHDVTAFEPGLAFENEQERAYELAWVKENGNAFGGLAQHGYTERGRGALVIGVAVVRLDEMKGHPYIYLNADELEAYRWSEAAQNVKVYEPTKEFVTVLVKSHSENVYRIGVTGDK